MTDMNPSATDQPSPRPVPPDAEQTAAERPSAPRAFGRRHMLAALATGGGLGVLGTAFGPGVLAQVFGNDPDPAKIATGLWGATRSELDTGAVVFTGVHLSALRAGNDLGVAAQSVGIVVTSSPSRFSWYMGTRINSGDALRSPTLDTFGATIESGEFEGHVMVAKWESDVHPVPRDASLSGALNLVLGDSGGYSLQSTPVNVPASFDRVSGVPFGIA